MVKFEPLSSVGLDTLFKKGIPILSDVVLDSVNIRDSASVDANLSCDTGFNVCVDSQCNHTLYSVIADELNDVGVKIVNSNSADESSIDGSYSSCLNVIASSLNKLCVENDNKISEFSDSLTGLALLISKSVIDKEVKNFEHYGGIIHDIINTLKKVERDYFVTIRVNPVHEEKLLSDFSSRINFANCSDYKFVFDESISECDSVVEWEDGRVENMLQNRINRLEALIVEYFGGLNRKYGNN